MTDYSAYDIHRIDQAAPDAFNDVDQYIGDPEQKRRLAEQGPAVYAAELTRDLAASAASPMSLAGWAAMTTVRLMEAGRVWEEDTDAAYAKVDELTAELDQEQSEHQATLRNQSALSAEVLQLRAELDRVRAEVAAAHNHAHRQDTNLQQITRAKDELANERDQLKTALGQIAGMCNCRAADDCPSSIAQQALATEAEVAR